MANFAYMDNMLDLDQAVDKGYSSIDHSDLMAWFDQPFMPQQDRGYDGLFSSFLETNDATSPLELKEEELQSLLLHEEEEEGGRLSPTSAAATTSLSTETAIHLPKYKKRYFFIYKIRYLYHLGY